MPPIGSPTTTSTAVRGEFTERPQIDISYGASTWRAEQSIIDILQNHLDAQQKVHGVGALPVIELLIENCGTRRWVAYDSVKQLSMECQIQGFRVSDRGAGFAHQFLGMIGASPKSERDTARGGLGEGLKMSCAHLLREGCTISLSSAHVDGGWSCCAKHNQNQLVFEGHERITPPQTTGSHTEVIFPSQSAHREIFIAMLDSRAGPALSRYILDFNRQHALYIHSDRIITDQNPGRIYVKGLFVEEVKDVLFAYNLGAKWAISGRDRKNVVPATLSESARRLLAESDQHSGIAEKVITALAKGEKRLETTLLTGDMKLAAPHSTYWREAVTKLLGIIPGKQIIGPLDMSIRDIERLEESGIKVLILDISSSQLDFIDGLFPGEVVSVQKLLKKRTTNIPREPTSAPSAGVTNHTPQHTAPESVTPERVVTAVSPEIVKFVGDLKQKLIQHLLHNQSSLRGALPDVLMNLRDIQLVRSTSNAVSVEITRPDLMMLEVPDNLTPQTKLRILSASVKIAMNSEVESVETQTLATALMGGEIEREFATPIPCPESLIPAGPNPTSLEARTAHITADEKLVDSARDASRVLCAPTPPLASLAEIFPALSLLSQHHSFHLYSGPEGLFTISPTGETRAQSAEEMSRDYNRQMQSMRSANHFLPGPRAQSGWFEIPLPSSENSQLFRVFPENDRLDCNTLPLFFSGTFTISYNNDIIGSNSSRIPPQLTADTLQAAPFKRELGKNQLAIVPLDTEIGSRFRLTHHGAVKNEYYISIQERSGQICLCVEGEDFYQVHIGRGVITIPKIANISLQFGAIHLTTNDAQITLQAEPSSLPSVKNAAEDPYRGSAFIKGSMVIDYGSQIWNNPRRPLFNCIQNHMDAAQGARPTLTYTVQHSDSTRFTVSEAQLKQLGTEYKILHFSMSDTGAGFDSHHLIALGSSTKGPGDRGQYGEGLKLLVCACLRNSVGVELRSRDWQAHAKSFTKSVRDYEDQRDTEYALLGFRTTWDQPLLQGSQTAFSAPAVSSEATLQFWQGLCELVDPRAKDPKSGLGGIDRFVLTSQPATGFGQVQLLAGQEGQIFENGLLLDAPGQDSTALGYNFLGQRTITTSRERNTWETKPLVDALSAALPHFMLEERFASLLVRSCFTNSPYVEGKLVSGYSSRFSSSDAAKAAVRLALIREYGPTYALSWRKRLESLSMRPYGFTSLEARELTLFKSQLKEAQRNVDFERRREDQCRFIVAGEDTFHSLLGCEAVHSGSLLALEENMPVLIGEVAEEKALAVIRAADRFFLSRLSELRQHDENRPLLEELGISDKTFEALEGEIAKREATQIGWLPTKQVVHGRAHYGDGVQLYSYNVSLLRDPRELFRVHLHELTHRVTGMSDYVSRFQQALLLSVHPDLLPIALHREAPLV